MVYENVLPDYLQKVPNLPIMMIQEETKKNQPTIVDIARNLNISPASVSRALRDAGKVGPELKAKVLEEAERIGYRPNYAAKALRNQSSQLIGLIIPNFFSFQIDELVTYIQKYSQKEHYGIILGLTQWDPQLEIAQLDFMLSKRVEGIIIKSKGINETIEKIHQISLNGTKIVSLLDDVALPNVKSVLVDNVMGGYLATKHLLEHGHRKILYATYQLAKSNVGNDSHFSRERYFGMLRAYTEMNITRPDNLVFYDESSCEDNHSEENFREFLRKNNDFTAVFTYDDQIAAGVVRAIKAEGYSIPEDFSVISYDDSMLVNRWSTPPLTVIKQPDEKVAFEAVNQILYNNDDNRQNNTSSASSCLICPDLIQRQSVAKPREI
ncbi:MAG: LacI family DNA-binding transcriptional regulator [Sedimentisphaeraceae bacterium JB056]